jgi:hypothetical protein
MNVYVLLDSISNHHGDKERKERVKGRYETPLPLMNLPQDLAQWKSQMKHILLYSQLTLACSNLVSDLLSSSDLVLHPFQNDLEGRC